MALPSIAAQAFARWIAYYLREGESEEDVRTRWEGRHPGLPITRYMTSLRYARQMLRVGERAAALPEGATLSEALGRGAQPAPTVEVSLLYKWSDATGHIYYNTIKVEASWNATIADIRAEADDLIAQIWLRYPGQILVGASIIPSLLWPGEAGQ